MWIQQQLFGAEEKKTAAVIASRSSSDGASPGRYIGMLVELATYHCTKRLRRCGISFVSYMPFGCGISQ